MILGSGYPLVYTAVFALGILIIRLVINFGVYKTLVEENESDQEPPASIVEFEMVKQVF